MSLLQRLIRDLNEAGAQVIPLGGDEYAVSMTRADGHVTDLHFVVHEHELQALIQNLSEDGHAVFPEVPLTEAGYRLLLVHVDEALATQPSSSRVRLTSGGIEVDRPAGAAEVPPPDPADAENLRWTHERPQGS